MKAHVRLVEDTTKGRLFVVGAHASRKGFKTCEVGLDLSIGQLPTFLHAWTVGWGWEEAVPLRPWPDLLVDTLPVPGLGAPLATPRIVLSWFGFFVCVCPYPLPESP